MTTESAPDLLVLHAVRILGFADTAAIARRFDLDPVLAHESLQDAEAYGWVQRAAFADLRGWSLTERGRREGERVLAAELGLVDGEAEVRSVYGDFLPLNVQLLRACTDWQLRPASGDRLASNDHSDSGWDGRVLDELAQVGRGVGPLVERLGAVLLRLRGYDERFDAALRRARAGDPGWVDRTDVDSCHRVWFELHEDLIATLGISRRSDP
jgi:hypothetical protein